jgi:hypothetical protein
MHGIAAHSTRTGIERVEYAVILALWDKMFFRPQLHMPIFPNWLHSFTVELIQNCQQTTFTCFRKVQAGCMSALEPRIGQAALRKYQDVSPRLLMCVQNSPWKLGHVYYRCG